MTAEPTLEERQAEARNDILRQVTFGKREAPDARTRARFQVIEDALGVLMEREEERTP